MSFEPIINIFGSKETLVANYLGYHLIIQFIRILRKQRIIILHLFLGH
jgi:hypothetical protein